MKVKAFVIQSEKTLWSLVCVIRLSVKNVVSLQKMHNTEIILLTVDIINASGFSFIDAFRRAKLEE